jgi:hypothetical protein
VCEEVNIAVILHRSHVALSVFGKMIFYWVTEKDFPYFEGFIFHELINLESDVFVCTNS